MNEAKKTGLKKWLNILFIPFSFGIVAAIAFSNGELKDAWQTLFTLKPAWLLAALGGWFSYLFFDALSLYFFFRKQGCPIRFRYAAFVSVIGFYYSNITPGASGGQPVQIFYLSKRNVPVGVSTSAATVRLLCMQFMVVLIGLLLWLFNLPALAPHTSGGIRWLVIIGGVINFSAVPLILLVAFYRPPVEWLVRNGIRLGVKLRMIKNPEALEQKAADTLDSYHKSILEVSKTPSQFFLQLFFMGASLFCFLSIPVPLYYAFGLSGTPWYIVLALSYMIFWSASYTLPPGGSGMQEGGFWLLYQGVFTSGTVGLAMLVWRFINFYLAVLTGPLLSLLFELYEKRKAAAEASKSGEKPVEEKP